MRWSPGLGGCMPGSVVHGETLLPDAVLRSGSFDGMQRQVNVPYRREQSRNERSEHKAVQAQRCNAPPAW